MSWFDIDRSGLANIVSRKSKAFIVFELVSNAWDAGANNVDVYLEPLAGKPTAKLTVIDDAHQSWCDLSHAFTLFARSERASNPGLRGRFNLGEKLVLSMCVSARIETTKGTLRFEANGKRRKTNDRTQKGTVFSAVVRLTRDELREVVAECDGLIPPTMTRVNSTMIPVRDPIEVFNCKLPTEIETEDGMRRSVRTGLVAAYDGDGMLCELGIPVCRLSGVPFDFNVKQKIPLGLERDTTTESFRKALLVAAFNHLGIALDDQQAGEAWVTEAMGDARAQRPAIAAAVVKRFGERAVIATPGDPIANANAQASGATVIHGGALPSGAWANIRKHELLPAASQAFPTPKPKAEHEICKACGQIIR